jgi:hypothetical protein
MAMRKEHNSSELSNQTFAPCTTNERYGMVPYGPHGVGPYLAICKEMMTMILLSGVVW